MVELNHNIKVLIPAIIQDDEINQILMLGYMNKEAIEKTLKGPDVWFYSRSRQEMWHKGATSGNYLKVRSVMKDCENYSLLVRAKPMEPTCHTGNVTCFYREY
jgi:phosphoribosyl-ATP pyrophosphohydrolase/phosphoribosyl-AMP cyclohydrolase